MKAGREVAWLGLALALGCAAPSVESPRRGLHPAAPVAQPHPTPAAPPALTRSAVPQTVTKTEATLLVTEPATLKALESRGLLLASVLGSKLAEPDDNSRLSRLPAFSALTRVLTEETARAARGDKLAGVDVGRYAHRLFDVRFLRSEKARFELVGVVNRLDRAPFAPGSCGETRLIYRLAYRHDPERASRLPMTLGVELTVPKPAGGCREVAQRWLEPAGLSPDQRAAWLSSEAGPISPDRVALTPELARVVVNLQLVRWPSTMRPDLGGHAEYVLRSFRLDQHGTLQPELLENTPDLAPGLAGTERRKELLSWLRSTGTSQAIAAGTPLLPRSVLSERSVSVTPRGLARLANRPFSSALSTRDVAGLASAADSAVQSPEGLLRRLDQLSCPGCHQARSVAGFHLLGEDAPDAAPENSLAAPISAHVSEDLPRRARLLRQVLEGSAPDFAAPFAERANPGAGGYGAHCGLGQDPTFASWTCERGLVCSHIEAAPGDLVGQCLPAVHGVGDACERGSVLPHPNRLKDRTGPVSVEECDGAVCNRSSVGFPGGMCTAGCGAAGSTCGAIAILDSFNACLGRGGSFLSCVRKNTRPAGLRGCSNQAPCRDDYVCAKADQGGVCLPPYFVFQLRVDGHSSQSP